MLEELNCSNKTMGAKQARRALNDGRARKVFLADDADPRIIDPIARLAAEQGVPIEKVPTMRELGSACGIAVGSAVAVII